MAGGRARWRVGDGGAECTAVDVGGEVGHACRYARVELHQIRNEPLCEIF